jgi:hypothetical protein
VGFPAHCEVVVKQEDDENWVTRSVIKYTGRIESFEVPEDSPTDFASVPRVFVWFLPRYGRYTKAAILHDYLWRQRAKNGKMPWRDADAIFRKAMRDLGVPFLRRWIMWTAVRWAALKNLQAWRERRLFVADLPRMLLFTAVALPIVVPPAVVILGALVVWLVVEAVVWLPLKAGEQVQRLYFPDRSRKQVNAPQLDFKS